MQLKFEAVAVTVNNGNDGAGFHGNHPFAVTVLEFSTQMASLLAPAFVSQVCHSFVININWQTPFAPGQLWLKIFLCPDGVKLPTSSVDANVLNFGSEKWRKESDSPELEP